MMDEAMTTSSPLSTIAVALPEQKHQEVKPKAEIRDQPATSMTIATIEPSEIAFDTSEGGESRHSPKRSRAEESNAEDALPAHKRVATEAVRFQAGEPAHLTEQQLPDEIPACDNEGDINATDEAKHPKWSSQSNSKPAVKIAVHKPSRGRACAECKRRKVSQADPVHLNAHIFCR